MDRNEHQNQKQKVWKDKYGKEYLFEKLSDRHLENTIQWVYRTGRHIEILHSLYQEREERRKTKAQPRLVSTPIEPPIELVHPGEET